MPSMAAETEPLPILPRSPLLALLSWASAALLVLILAATGLVMGGAREWIILPVYGLAALLLLVQALRVGLLRAFPRRFDAADLCAALFLLYAFVRHFTAPVEYLARLEFFQIAACAIVFWTARYGLARAAHGVFVLAGFIAVALAVALFSFWLKLHPGFDPYGETLHTYYAPRLTGTFGCPNHYGAFLYMGVAAALAIALFLRRRWFVRIGLFYVAAIFAVGIALSISRGSWLGFLFVLVAVAVFCVRHAGLKWYWPVGLLAFLLAAGALALAVLPTKTTRIDEVINVFSSGRFGGYVRVRLAHDAARIIGDHFWFGTGPATFVHIHPRYQDPHYDTLAIYTHDDYLNTWCDYGLLGLLPALGFVAAAAFGLARRIDPRAPWQHRALACAGAAAFSGLVVQSFVEFAMHIPACAFALFTLAGLGLRRREPRPGEEEKPVRRWVHLGAAAALLAGALLFATAVGVTARGYYPYRRIAAHPEGIPIEEAALFLRQAIAADPRFAPSSALLADFYRADAAQKENPEDRRKPAQEAVKLYLAALRQNPLEDGLYMRLGMAYDLLNAYDIAYLCYGKITALQPYNGFFWNALGLHFLQRGMKDRALQAFDRSTRCPYGGEAARDTLRLLKSGDE